MRKIQYIILLLVLNIFSNISAQETIDAGGIDPFIFGGDQKSNVANIELLLIMILDVEPDPNNTVDFGVYHGDLEAGNPVFTHPTHGRGTVSDESLWINFTYRGYPGQQANIHVRSNMPVPGGIKIQIHIKQAGAGGEYDRHPQFHSVTLSETDQVIVRHFPRGYTGDGEFHGFQIRYHKENHGGNSLPPGFEVMYEIRPAN